MTDYHENFMQKLRFYRKRAGMTQAQLAECCNVSNGTIGNIECGITKPSFDLIIKIADILQISPAEFFKMEIESRYQDDYLTSSQFEMIRETFNSTMNEAVVKAMQNLKNVKFRIEH